VDVYSTRDQVRLLLNGVDLGLKPVSRETRFIASWQVPYVEGVLTAVGYSSGKEMDRRELRTAGDPAGIRLCADRTAIRADGQDLSYVTVEIVDANGELVPSANNLIAFSVSGEGTLAAVGNSKPDSLESFQQPRRAAYEGRCLAILKSTRAPGRIVLTASSEGLPDSSIIIEVNR
jgi:beta-galactosidase